jgi:putative salt-induced outer membrane protein YdiY
MRLWALLLVLVFPSGACGQAILNVENLQRDDSEGFGARISSNLNLTSGNTEVFQLGGSLGVGFLSEHHWIRLFGGLDRLKKGSDEIVNNEYAHLRYNYLIAQRFRSFHFLQLQTNEKLFLKRRFLAGSGLRYGLLKGERVELDVGTGVMLEMERLDADKLQPGEDPGPRVVRMANLMVGSGAMGTGNTWTVVLYYQPVFRSFRDYRLSSEAGLGMRITDSLTLDVAFTWRHDNRAPKDLEADDYAFKTGLSLTLG